MIPKGETALRSKPAASAFIALAALCLLSSESLAQQASAVSGTRAVGTSWSLRAPHYEPTPFLQIAMAAPVDGSFSDTDRESEENVVEHLSVASLPTALSGLTDRSLNQRGSQKTMLSDQHIVTTSSGAGTKVFSLSGNGSGSGSFRYQTQKKDFRLDQWSTDSVAPAHGAEPSFRPLFQVQVGSWHLPVMLSAAQR